MNGTAGSIKARPTDAELIERRATSIERREARERGYSEEARFLALARITAGLLASGHFTDVDECGPEIHRGKYNGRKYSSPTVTEAAREIFASMERDLQEERKAERGGVECEAASDLKDEGKIQPPSEPELVRTSPLPFDQKPVTGEDAKARFAKLRELLK